MAMTEMNYGESGGSAEKPVALFEGSWNSGSKSVLHNDYEVLIFVAGWSASTQRPITVLKKNASTTVTMVACGAFSSRFYRYLTVELSSNAMTITASDDSGDTIYGVYGAHSMNVDLSDLAL